MKKIRMEEFPIVALALGYERKSVVRATKLILNLKNEVEDNFKINPKSIKIRLKNPTGRYDTISVLHPTNGFYNRNGKYGIALCNRGTSFKNAKKRNIDLSDYLKIE